MTTSPYILQQLAEQRYADLLREARREQLAGEARRDGDSRLRRTFGSLAALATRLRSRERAAEVTPAAA